MPKIHPFRASSLRLLTALAVAAAVGSAQAQSYWKGGDGNWADSAHWLDGQPSGDVVIGSTYGNPTTTTVDDNPNRTKYESYIPAYFINSLTSSASLVVKKAPVSDYTLRIQEGGEIAGSLDLQGGGIYVVGGSTGTKKLSVTGASTFSGGLLSGNLDFANGLTSTGPANGPYRAFSTSYEQAITLHGESLFGGFIGGESLTSNSTGGIENLGTLVLQNATLSGQGTITDFRLRNLGTIKSTGDEYVGLTLDNRGTIEVANGSSLRFAGNGVNSGLIDATKGTVHIGLPQQYSVFSIASGGTVEGNVEVSGSGLFVQHGGTLTGSLTIGRYGFTYIEADTSLTSLTQNGYLGLLSGAKLTLSGTSFFGADGGLFGSGDSTLQNDGTATLMDTYIASNGGSNRFVNNGTARVSGGSLGFSFENVGLAEVLAGTAMLVGGGTNAGQLRVDPGATLAFSSKAFALDGASLLEIAVGPASFGKLTVGTSGLELGGTLTGVVASGVTVNVGDHFRFLTGTYTGSFDAFGAGWSAEYGANFVDLVRVQAVPEPASLAVLGLGAVGFLRRRRR